MAPSEKICATGAHFLLQCCSLVMMRSSDRQWFLMRPSELLHMGESLNTTWNGRFRAAFGVSFGVLQVVWDLLDPEVADCRPKYPREHLLWALYFLKTYTTEVISATFFSTSERTWRKWVTIVVKDICLYV